MNLPPCRLRRRDSIMEFIFIRYAVKYIKCQDEIKKENEEKKEMEYNESYFLFIEIDVLNVFSCNHNPL